MTQTAAGLRRLGLPHARARVVAVALGSAGGILAVAAIASWLAPSVLPVVAGWLAIAGVLVFGWSAARRVRRSETSDLGVLGELVEHVAGVRAGSVVGTGASTDAPGRGMSAALWTHADSRAARVVAQAAPEVDRMLGRTTRLRLGAGIAVAGLGAGLFTAASPAPGRAAFLHPIRTLVDARAPVRLSVDRSSVRRGEGITVTIDAPTATRATLWTRGPGEPWQPTPVALDAAGRGQRRLDSLTTDLFLRATSGPRRSAEQKISVALPAFLADFEIAARFPTYLRRPDQEVVAGPDTVPIPAGTEVLVNGALSVSVGQAAWKSASGATTRLEARGRQFSGRLAPATSGAWRLDLSAGDGSPIEGDVPELRLRIVPDSAPVVTIAVPAKDTTLPISLRQPLVIDARDDHGLGRVEIVSWRVSRTGKVGEPVRQALDVSGAGDRALIQGELDGEHRGLLPGDTLRFRVDAWDNAPAPHRGTSAEIALRLPSLEELRAATRAATREIVSSADSLAAAQSALSDRTGDLAHEQPRDPAAGPADRRAAGAQAGALPFEASERAAAIVQQQTELEQRARDLARRVDQVARSAAGALTDSAFQARIAEVQDLLQRALTPELEQRLRELQDALSRLDPEAARRALDRLAESQRQFRDALERGQDLFRRAAVEGALASLAADAEDLGHRQAEWDNSDARHLDSASAGREQALVGRADSLRRGIAQAAADMSRASPVPGSTPLAGAAAAAERARGAMRQAADAAAGQDASGAGRAGKTAEDALAEIPNELRNRRDSVIQAWRRETLDALDRALGETAALAERQQQVAESLRNGVGGAPTRAKQASVEEGAAAVERQIRVAEGRHALVSPQLQQGLGFARRQMRASREELEEATPNLESAAALAEQAVDALNATAYALARTRGDVAGAQSGTGLAEALERLARLAEQQGEMSGQAQGLLPMPGGSGAMLEQLRALAAQQRALADQLDRLRAEGVSEAAGPLAKEARDLAAQLDAGRLDAQIVQRQQRLYHRLLDAGRTIQGSEPDDQKQPLSRAATGDSVHVPKPFAASVAGEGPRLRYPTWDELRDLTPDQRRLVLEYFRRLNAPTPR